MLTFRFIHFGRVLSHDIPTANQIRDSCINNPTSLFIHYYFHRAKRRSNYWRSVTCQKYSSNILLPLVSGNFDMSSSRGTRSMSGSSSSTTGSRNWGSAGAQQDPSTDPSAKYMIVQFERKNRAGIREIGIICTHWLLNQRTPSGQEWVPLFSLLFFNDSQSHLFVFLKTKKKW
jgi:hypothetical protein